MDTRTGGVRNLTAEESAELAPTLANKTVRAPGRKLGGINMGAMKPIDPANLTPRARRQLESTGRTMVSRNSPCPCGSRKRFKRCCMTA